MVGQVTRRTVLLTSAAALVLLSRPSLSAGPAMTVTKTQIVAAVAVGLRTSKRAAFR